jgi:hypothetical protein
MANSVDLVIGSEAIKQVETLISKLSIADAELLKISQSALGASKGISGISTPSGLDKTVSSTTALNAQLEKQNTIINKLHADLAKKAEQSRLAEIRLQQQREKAFDSFEKNAQKEQALNAKNETSYQRIQNSVALLTKTYQDLAIRKQLGSTLTAKEESQLTSLTTRIKTYQDALLKTDATIGKNQRNVGNYASGYNALGNSINQLTREAPAFANSIQTGFMAISNNFAALQDAVKGIVEQNKILRAEGKPTESVFKQLAGGVFSWTTAISIAVTLLTVYGAKLVELVFGLGNTEVALKKLETQQKKYNSSLQDANDTIDHNLALEKNRLKQLGASDQAISDLEINASKRKLKNAETKRDYDKKELDDEAKKILSKKGIIIEGFSEEIGLYESLIAKKLSLEKSLGKEIVKYTYLARTEKEKAEVEILAKTNIKIGALGVLSNNEIYQKKKQFYIDSENAAKKSGLALSELVSNNKTKEIEEGKKLTEESIKLEEDRLKSIADLRKKELELQLANIDEKVNNEDLYYSDRLTALDADFLKRVEIAKVDYDEEIRLSKGSQEKQKIALIDFQLEKLKLIEDYNKKKNTLEQLDLDPITKLATPKNQDKDPFKFVTDSAEKAVKSMKNIDVSDGTSKLKTDWKQAFSEIADAAQEAGDIIAEFSQRNFENEYARLEAQKDISLKFAGDNASAKAKIEEDYDKKRKEIANRENKAKQKQAIFNIAIDTAQAIAGAVAKSPETFGLPWSAFAAAMGVAQIALVTSQKIPQYFDGTDNHIGGMMLVNDGAGVNFQEKIILPNGKEIMPEGRNVLMNAPKGTKVLTHEQQIMEMLNERGISMSAKYSQNNGMTANEMDGIMSKHFAKIQVNNTSFDRKGFRSWSESNGNKTIQNNNRVSRTGFRV